MKIDEKLVKIRILHPMELAYKTCYTSGACNAQLIAAIHSWCLPIQLH
jgi:hypothetical protein